MCICTPYTVSYTHLSLTALILQYHLDPGTIHLQQIISALFPTVTQLWWYTTCYVLFLIFLPFLNLSF